MIDLIGDIHGNADKLNELLGKHRYSLKNEVFSHFSRKVLIINIIQHFETLRKFQNKFVFV